MTIHDLRCDLCGRLFGGPEAAVRFVFHPGVPELRDDSGLACGPCWDAVVTGLDVSGAGRPSATNRCAACGGPAPRRLSLHVRRFDLPGSWRLCGRHAVAFLNALRTVEPKLDAATFRFPATARAYPADPGGHGQ